MATESCVNTEEKKEERHAAMACDYLVVGGGATGMAFVDSLLAHAPSLGGKSASVVMVDKHDSPGGQWHDSYSFVRLHQPSSGYGVESEELEPPSTKESSASEKHRATRAEILEYYGRVQRKLEAKYDFRFVGGATFDFSSLDEAESNATGSTGRGNSQEGMLYRLHRTKTSNNAAGAILIRVMKRVVDARFLEPDLPIFVQPKFSFDQDSIQCIPINYLVSSSSEERKLSKHFVIIGGGKTGMDAITYLLTEMNVEPENIMWVVPNEVWITARENIGSCMEFLHTCTEVAKRKKLEADGGRGTGSALPIEDLVKSNDFFQIGFLEWERQGKVYRLDTDMLPTKFKDATLSMEEMTVIKKVTKVIRHGRVKAISNSGEMHFVDGSAVHLPWLSDGVSVEDTTFVHCSAGAFNYTKQPGSAPPVFSKHVITIQDIYGTPGFCFVGSLFGKLESMTDLTDADKNAMCLSPKPDASQAMLPLGPSGGDVGVISANHGYVQRLSNLKKWLAIPDMKKWLVGHRLFNLGHLDLDEMLLLVEETWDVLKESGLIEG